MLRGNGEKIKAVAADRIGYRLFFRGGLFDLNVAGAGADAYGGASAAYDGTDMVAVEAALHGHGLGDADVARAGVGVESEVGVTD